MTTGQAAYAPDFWAAQVKNPQDRFENVARQACEAVGAKLIGGYGTQPAENLVQGVDDSCMNIDANRAHLFLAGLKDRVMASDTRRCPGNGPSPFPAMLPLLRAASGHFEMFVGQRSFKRPMRDAAEELLIPTKIGGASAAAYSRSILAEECAARLPRAAHRHRRISHS